MATYTDQFYVMDPGNPPPFGTPLTVETYDFEDADDNDLIEPNVGDEFDGSEITAVWVNDVITVEYPDGSTDVITGITYYTADGRAVFTPNDGTILQDATFISSTFVVVSTDHDVGDLGPPCFVQGTLIKTDRGPVPVEQLAPGDLVWTLDHSFRPVRWRGGRAVDGQGVCAPIRFDAGMIGNTRPLLVSPEHRVLLSGWRAQLYFGEDEVLVAAKHFVDHHAVSRVPMDEVVYHHILFDSHEIVESEGVLTESFHPGGYLLEEDTALRDEILLVFPELANAMSGSGRLPARRVALGFEAEAMRAAHPRVA